MIQRILIGVGIFTASLWLLTGLVTIDRVPKPQGYVSDFAGVLKDNDRAALELNLQNYEARTGNVIALVTLENAGGEALPTYTTMLSQDWRLANQVERPVLVVIETSTRQAVINTGHGTDGMAPHPEISNIVNNDFQPKVAAGRYNEALEATVIKLQAVNIDTTLKLEDLPTVLRDESTVFDTFRVFLLGGTLACAGAAAFLLSKRHRTEHPEP